jgi:hypothetical protein
MDGRRPGGLSDQIEIHGCPVIQARSVGAVASTTPVSRPGRGHALARKHEHGVVAAGGSTKGTR